MWPFIILIRSIIVVLKLSVPNPPNETTNPYDLVDIVVPARILQTLAFNALCMWNLINP